MGISNTRKASLLLTFFFCVAGNSVLAQKFKVTLDAGHGGKDFGAVYHGHIEKNIALGVVQKVGKILEGTPGFDVVYTRKSDVFIELVERANIANRADSHIFVSIHCNANKNTAAEGTETYVMGMNKNASNLEAAKRENSVITLEKDYKQKYEGYDPSSPETMIGVELMQEEFLDNSISLASKIQDMFVRSLGKKSRGVKQAPFMVLHKAYMPRVLIEMGFISNPKDGAFLDSEDGQDEMAKAIANAIIGYKKEYFGSGNYDPANERPSQRITDTPVAETPAPVAAPERTTAQTPFESDASGIVFKVQISASGNKLATTPSNFKGLSGVSVQSDGKLFKYFYGETPDYQTARQKLSEAKTKGFPSAYVVAFRNGQRISLDEALKK
ncbi:N-acetylmuramoyl-L-alanine amidase family protein [Flavobacterium selenitireducens]|uniref:N-acetylmuramoyl-L-alanine amidase family protein n=1 Tax=Flavobacterium selenitireducens TaxID=2722704 RepID=UPI00168B67CF|nr:N-acetylmuramoyl-L-alanine amidase [Flavobacterium selenitireducens]MBD3580956.1 N-acetylmuramoyl-L-alanine amidase [Flavobacterium selenitireducens]